MSNELKGRRILLADDHAVVRLGFRLLLEGVGAEVVAEADRLFYEQGFDHTSFAAIADGVGISRGNFYHHFKTVTAMTPLQFQKQLRLQEARRLMLVENLNAASAAYRVGYNDASHFSRDYKNLFGLPPLKDVKRLRRASLKSSD